MQLPSGDLMKQEQAGFEPGAARWILPALPLSHHTTVNCAPNLTSMVKTRDL